jgi:hypothetical protein
LNRQRAVSGYINFHDIVMKLLWKFHDSLGG